MTYDFTKLKTTIHETEEWLAYELRGIRTGRAAPALLDTVKPEAYCTRTPLMQLANVSIEDARTLRVIPWDTTLIKTIEKGITDADLGVGISTDGQGVRVSFPELTSERRTQLSRLAGEKTEQARVTLRANRTDALHALDAAKKEGGIGEDEITRLKGEVQKLIDASNEVLATLLQKKEEDITL